MKHFLFSTETTTSTPTPTTTPGKVGIQLVRILIVSIHFTGDIISNYDISVCMCHHNISAYLYLACIENPECHKLASFCGNLIIQKQCRLTCGLCGE